MRGATSFPEAEGAVISALKAAFPALYVSNVTPAPIPAQAVTVGFSGGGYRSWGEAAVNVGVNVFATTEKACRELTLDVLDVLAAVSNSEIHHVDVPAGGGTTVTRQTPPFQRYFAATVHLLGQANLPLDAP